jgi:hypothetical protein
MVSFFCWARFCVPWYIGTMINTSSQIMVERVQTGVRMEKRILKVLKGFAEYHDITLGDLLEGIVLHAFDGKMPFNAESLSRIRELKKFYGLDLDSRASHKLVEGRHRALKVPAAQKKMSEKEK